MEPIENLFQIPASMMLKIGRYYKINSIIQYRIILGLVALAQTSLVTCGFYFLSRENAVYIKFDEILTIYVYIYLGIITTLTVIQWRFVFAKNKKITCLLNQSETSLQEKLEILTKRRESYVNALVSALFFSFFFWIILKQNTELVGIFMIPAFMDISANILATCWEFAFLTESKPELAQNR